MTLGDLYLLNNDWSLDTIIFVYHGIERETMAVRKAVRLFGTEKVYGFSQTAVWLY